jgi:hypothetical protein
MAGSGRSRGFGIRERIVALAAAVVGFVAGVVVNVVWPNPTYGFQIMAGAVAIGLMLLGIPLWRRRRSEASVTIAAGAGLLLGIGVGYNVRPGSAGPGETFDEAGFHVDIIEPAVATLNSRSGQCLVRGDRLMLLESPDAVSLVDGRSVSVMLSQGAYRPAPNAAPDGLTVDVRVAWALDDGSPTETWMGSDATSTVTVTGTADSGVVEFSGLVLRPDSEQRDPIDVVGSVSWSCGPP